MRWPRWLALQPRPRRPCSLTVVFCFSGILDICLDLNENPSLPPELRFNVTPPDFHRDAAIQVDADITPENANQTVHEYKLAVQAGTIPQMDIYIIRSEVERVLAAQESRPLDEVLATLPTRPVSGVDKDALPEEIRGDDPPGLLSTERETERLLRLDAQLGDPVSIKRLAESTGRLGSQFEEEKHPASMTPRELERHVELLNPQSQHSWLKAHHKLGPEINDNDAESLASHETGAKAARKRSKNLAKQRGDRARERASAMESGDEDSMVEDLLGAGSERRKRGGRREDGSYHPKMGMGGAAGGGGGKKGKRKRSEGGEGAAGGGKKARVEGGVLE